MGSSIGFNTVRRKRTNHRNSREGYVLIMTLVLIVLAVLSEVGLVRRSLRLALEAVEAQKELQHHWGSASCRTLFLDQASTFFEQAAKLPVNTQPLWPQPNLIKAQVVLADTTYRLWLRDEDARVNLNTLQKRLPEKGRMLVTDLTSDLLPLRWQPDVSPQAKKTKRSFSSWGQLFDLPQIWQADGLESLLQATDEITCWGSGKLNIHTVSDTALDRVVGQTVSHEVSRKIIEARSQSQQLAWPEMLKSLDLRPKQSLTLRIWISNKSSCYSLWLELENSQRSWYHLWIRGDRASAAQTPLLSFSW